MTRDPRLDLLYALAFHAQALKRASNPRIEAYHAHECELAYKRLKIFDLTAELSKPMNEAEKRRTNEN